MGEYFNCPLDALPRTLTQLYLVNYTNAINNLPYTVYELIIFFNDEMLCFEKPITYYYLDYCDVDDPFYNTLTVMKNRCIINRHNKQIKYTPLKKLIVI
jgi:hypothetical protein